MINTAEPRCSVCSAQVTDVTLDARRRTVVEPLPERKKKARKTQVEFPSNVAPKARPAIPYRPLHRPPIGLLIALDDGSANEGETWRVRRTRHVIGRKEGDTVIPHDGDISARHAEITCRWQDGRYHWHLTDLDSTNGTFLRVRRSAITDRKEIFLGCRRYQFLLPSASDPGSDVVVNDEFEVTRFHDDSRPQRVEPSSPRLAEMSSRDQPANFLISKGELVIGNDPARCGAVIVADPCVDEVHAKIFLDPHGLWLIEDQNSLNGIWIRVTRALLENDTQFQLGEQRFIFRVTH
jgi:pSer/pThr/pTyr-binding forkhead associated (FHA) protein